MPIEIDRSNEPDRAAILRLMDEARGKDLSVELNGVVRGIFNGTVPIAARGSENVFEKAL